MVNEVYKSYNPFCLKRYTSWGGEESFQSLLAFQRVLVPEREWTHVIMRIIHTLKKIVKATVSFAFYTILCHE